MRLRVKFNDHGLIKRFQAVEKGAVLRKVKQSLKPHIKAEESKMRERVNANFVRGRTGNSRLQRRSGALYRSIGSRVHTLPGVGGAYGGIRVEIGVVRGSAKTKRYALTQILGTVGAGGTLPDIRPKRSKLLMIPVNEALSNSGEQLFTPRQAKSRYDDVYFVKERGSDRVFLYGKSGDTSELLFIGVKRVAIRPHPFLTENKEKFMSDAKDVARKALSESLR